MPANVYLYVYLSNLFFSSSPLNGWKINQKTGLPPNGFSNSGLVGGHLFSCTATEFYLFLFIFVCVFIFIQLDFLSGRFPHFLRQLEIPPDLSSLDTFSLVKTSEIIVISFYCYYLVFLIYSNHCQWVQIKTSSSNPPIDGEGGMRVNPCIGAHPTATAAHPETQLFISSSSSFQSDQPSLVMDIGKSQIEISHGSRLMLSLCTFGALLKANLFSIQPSHCALEAKSYSYKSWTAS